MTYDPPSPGTAPADGEPELVAEPPEGLHQRHGEHAARDHGHGEPRVVAPVQDRVDEGVAVPHALRHRRHPRGCGGRVDQGRDGVVAVAPPRAPRRPVDQREGHVPQPEHDGEVEVVYPSWSRSHEYVDEEGD